MWEAGSGRGGGWIVDGVRLVAGNVFVSALAVCNAKEAGGGRGR